MADRVIYRDPVTGVFISAQEAGLRDAIREVYREGELAEQELLRGGRIVDLYSERREPNWQEVGSKWGSAMDAGGDMLDLGALEDSDFPEGYDSFRVLYSIPDNPDYPGGFASDTWRTADEWPPDLRNGASKGATGIARIYLRSE